MWWSRRSAVAAAVLGLLALSSCGFQARTAIELPGSVSSVYIDAPDRDSEIYRELDTTLRARGLQLTKDSGSADMVIRVLADDTGRRVTAVSAQNKPREYDVFYRVKYSVWKDGQEVLPAREISAQRNYNYDETQVLGKVQEERSLREAQAKDLVARVLRRLSTLK